jgi:hypothetical protein
MLLPSSAQHIMCLTPQLNKRQLEGGDHLVAVYGDNFLSAAHFSLSALAVSPATAPQQAALQKGDAELLQKRLALTDFQVKELVTVCRHVDTSVYMHTVMYSFAACYCSGAGVTAVSAYCCVHWWYCISMCTHRSYCSSRSTAAASSAVKSTSATLASVPTI